MASSAPFDVQKLLRPPNSQQSVPLNPAPSPSIPGVGPAPPSPYGAPPQAFSAPPTHGTYSYPPPTQPFHHHPFIHYPPDSLLPPISYPPPPQNHQTASIPASNPHSNPGARLMALLGTTSPAHIESAVSMPPPSSMMPPQQEFSAPPMILGMPSAPPAVSRAASAKAPRGRHLPAGTLAVYDVDSRLPGEGEPPQLEVTPITKYVSDPGLVLGRQIAVNRSYICYGLKLGAIRVLNINTALRSLLRGHNQRVTDMAFFAEDVHLLASASVDGKVFVWKIDEGPEEEDKPQITGRIVIAIHIVGDGESYHPRVCWHSHKQEILMLGIGNCVLKVDITKVARGKDFSAEEEPLSCPLDKLIDGVQCIGKHDAEITDLSISQWMTTRLASASKDGTVKIWDELKGLPLVTLRPHDGEPVNSVAFLTAPHRPDHIVLLTAGPLNREVKLWVSAGEEGWLLPSDSELWFCTQTLDLVSSSESRYMEAFFNQVVVLPRASLLILANAKKNAIYAVHVDYGPMPASTRMDYISVFCVTMPILSITGTSEFFSGGEQAVQVYCVQTQAIQQYAMDLSQCLPPSIDTVVMGKDSSFYGVSGPQMSEENSAPESSPEQAIDGVPLGSALPSPVYPVSSSENASSDLPQVRSIHELSSNSEVKASAPPLSTVDSDIACTSSFPTLNFEHSGGLPTFRGSSKGFEQGPAFGDHIIDQSVFDYTVDRIADVIGTDATNVSSVEEGSAKSDSKVCSSDISALPNLASKIPGNSTHLITPFEILSGAISSERSLVNHGPKPVDVNIHNAISINDPDNVHIGGIVRENSACQLESECHKELLVGSIDTVQTSEPYIDTAKNCVHDETYNNRKAHQPDDTSAMEGIAQSTSTAEEVRDDIKDLSEKAFVSSAGTMSPPLATYRLRKQRLKQSQGSGPTPHSPNLFNSTDSSIDPGSTADIPSLDSVMSQISAMHETVNQLVIRQNEMQKQMSIMVAGPINKEGKRLETSLGRTMEKAVKANIDALWARVQEENAKHEKIERERSQQLSTLITNSLNKEFPAILERSLKKEISALGQLLTRTITPVVEKSILSAITDSFQRCIGDKAVNQLEKSVASKLETAVTRQLQSQFQSSGKQALQDALRAGFESSLIPAFETSCKTMFEQIDAAFQKGMVEHTTAYQQQYDSSYTPLALSLRDALSSASSITQTISNELVDGQRKLLALVAAGGAKALNPLVMQPSNGLLVGHPEMLEAPVDPMKELQRLVSEHKFGDAFTVALQRSDVVVVSWLCSQVDLQVLLSTIPCPLNQGVLLSLVQQLACDINNETMRKLDWMIAVASAINPGDPSISSHVRRIIDQVYNMVNLQRSSPSTTPMDANKIRLLVHVLNSILMNCK